MQRKIVAMLPLCLVGLLACGGGKPEAAAPTDKPAMPAKEESKAEEADEEEASEEATAEEAPPEEEAKPLRSPKDIVTAEGVLFTFSFNESDIYAPTQEKCTAQAKGDPQKKAKCVAKAVAQFDGDGITFKGDKDGKWTWITIRRRGKSLKALNKIEVEFGEETDKTITVKPKGRDKGSKPKQWPKEIVIHVPSTSEIYLEDPKHGKMVYIAKHGLLGEAER